MHTYAAQQEGRVRLLECRCGGRYGRRRNGHARRRRTRHCGSVGFVPGGIGRQDQGRNLARCAARGLHRAGAVGGDIARTSRRAHPVRHRTRHAFDVGGQRGIVGDVVAGMLADDVDDAGARLLRVVQIGQPVAQARPQVQQGGGRLAGEPVIAVGRAGDHALEQAQHAAHALDLVQGRNEVHFGRAGVAEADLHFARHERAHQTFGSVHVLGFPDNQSVAMYPIGQTFAHPRAPVSGAPARSRVRRCPSGGPRADRVVWARSSAGHRTTSAWH